MFPMLSSDMGSSKLMVSPHEEELLVLVERIKKEVECCCSWHRYKGVTILCDQLIKKIQTGDFDDENENT